MPTILPDKQGPPGFGAQPLAESTTLSGASRFAVPSVLLVSADVNTLQVLKSSLDRAGFEVDTALRFEVGRQLFVQCDHDALVIEEGVGSFELCRYALTRQRAVAPCVLVLGARGDSAPLPAGAERLEKPLSLRFLVGRLTGQFGYFALSA